MQKYRNIPGPARKLLEHILPERDARYLFGDYEELYNQKRNSSGALSANIWIWLQVFRSLPGYAVNALFWSVIMLKNYLKITVRNSGGIRASRR